jgi:hypothetical protein
MIDGDLEKLSACIGAEPSWSAFLLVFGRKSIIERLTLPGDLLRERGAPVIAEFGITRFGCRAYEMTKRIDPRLSRMSRLEVLDNLLLPLNDGL